MPEKSSPVWAQREYQTSPIKAIRCWHDSPGWHAACAKPGERILRKAGQARRRNLSLKRAVLISNPLAGWQTTRRSQQIQRAVGILQAAGITTNISTTAKPGDASQLARKATNSGCDIIVVCGGDGTINEVINGVTPAQTPVAILPGGTANIIARELGLPVSIVKAAQQLPSWSPCRVALGLATWNDSRGERQRYFLAVAGIGFDAHIISQLSVPMKLRLGVAAYVWEALRQAFRYGFPSFDCAVNGTKASGTFTVIQRSERYAGWLHLARSRNILDPEFSCCHFRSSNRARYFLYALAVLTQTHYRLEDIDFAQGSRVFCTSRRPQDTIHFEVDGELTGQIPVTFDVVPDALTLLAPQSFVTSAE